MADNTIACQYKQLNKNTLVELIEKFDKVYIYCDGENINKFTSVIEEAVKKHGAEKVIKKVELRSVWNNMQRVFEDLLKDNAYNVEASLEFERYEGNKLK